MIKDYDYIVVETILRDIAFDGDWSDGQYLTFWMDGTDGYIEMEYSNYIDNYFPSDFENEIEETATIIHDSMNEECWIDIDSRELLVAFIIDFFKNTFNLEIERALANESSTMFNKMFKDVGLPDDYEIDRGYAYLKE
jgi:basic membrane lipoprotein Med (substrate-binding protein (PBP1-ABC) superfamily)